ncbi:hypothetical protein L596_007365 [Steinernema carpocapsae]|uniref:Uncharacterized protein n=1 Tax=Steinernema carpocapsae TaxID=34508 RepID=A0A4V6A602_STECR|nr:hypothetical protein L596_007365 [Steinernema carpocapsae]
MPHVLLDELENCFLDALRFCCPLISLIPATFKCVFRTFISLKRSSQTILHWFYFQILELTFEVLNFPKRKACVPPLNDPLPFLSATTAAERIRNKTLRSVDLVSAYVRRTEEVNCLINAISEENFDEALSNAAKVDSMLASADAATTKRICKSRPLLGFPFV